MTHASCDACAGILRTFREIETAPAAEDAALQERLKLAVVATPALATCGSNCVARKTATGHVGELTAWLRKDTASRAPRLIPLWRSLLGELGAQQLKNMLPIGFPGIIWQAFRQADTAQLAFGAWRHFVDALGSANKLPVRSRCPSRFRSEEVLHGGFVWMHRAFNSQTRRFSARAGGRDARHEHIPR
jgi:hypothetical protein